MKRGTLLRIGQFIAVLIAIALILCVKVKADEAPREHCYSDGMCIKLGKDVQGHFDEIHREVVADVKRHNWCGGHVESVVYNSGESWLLSCYSALTKKK
jgi:hypothetical protein